VKSNIKRRGEVPLRSIPHNVSTQQKHHTYKPEIVVMCIVAFHIQPQPAQSDYPQQHKIRFVLLCNRDEFASRPTLPLQEENENQITCARDGQAGGSQCMYHITHGILAILTNIRLQSSSPSSSLFHDQKQQRRRRSRGLLVQDAAFQSNENNNEKEETYVYEGFNLLKCNLKSNTVEYVTNHSSKTNNNKNENYCQRIKEGTHCLSNSFLNDDDWPKVVHLRHALQSKLSALFCNTTTIVDTNEFMSQLVDLLNETNVFPNDKNIDEVRNKLPKEMMTEKNKYHEYEYELQKGIYVSVDLKSLFSSKQEEQHTTTTTVANDDDEDERSTITCSTTNKNDENEKENSNSTLFQTISQTIIVSEYIVKTTNDANENDPTIRVHYWYRRTYSPTHHDKWTKYTYTL